MEIVDLKNKPSIFTTASMYISALSKTILKRRVTLPTIKVFFFVFDITKDVAFAMFLTNIFFKYETEELSSNDDLFLYFVYIFSLLFGQILLSVYCFLHRYQAISMCCHEQNEIMTMIKRTHQNFVITDDIYDTSYVTDAFDANELTVP